MADIAKAATSASLIGSALFNLILGSIVLFVLTDFLFRKNFLPSNIARIYGRFSFYPTMPLTFIMDYLRFGRSGCAPFITKIDNNVYLGGLPWMFLGRVEMLHRMGVKGVVNMCDEFDHSTTHYKTYGMTELNLPTVDHEEPTVEALTQAVEFIDQFVKRNEGVYIHCRAGRGRSAAVAFCWLLKSKGMDLAHTQEYIDSLRKVRGALWKQKNIREFYRRITEEKTRN
eukprot:TRINITY_DN2068_c0_g1_i1.p1 TRINITY_DN2068_c0_g1~~TRINITY_DN2068_c0_g1_i1.p1  ORF type:complete len:228 (-),score=84.82 TRINITY_DN2068_c0_g1_i1:101-784(-)